MKNPFGTVIKSFRDSHEWTGYGTGYGTVMDNPFGTVND